MAKKNKKNGKVRKSGGKRNILAVLLVLFAILIIVSVVTHTDQDDRLIAAAKNPLTVSYQNQIGAAGAISSYCLFFFLDWLSLCLPVVMIILALHLARFPWGSKVTPLLWFFIIAGFAVSVVINVYRIDQLDYPRGYTDAAGGYLVFYLTKFLVHVLGKTGTTLVMGGCITANLVILGFIYPALRKTVTPQMHISFAKVLMILWNGLKRLLQWIVILFKSKGGKKAEAEEGESEADLVPQEEESTELPEESVQDDRATEREKRREERKEKKLPPRKLKLKTPAIEVGRETKDYIFPGLDLLVENPDGGPAVSPDELTYTARALKDTLETFGVTIDGQIEKFPGPVITRFQFKPAAGVKVHQITNLSDDLALALQAKRIRIVAPIPGKAAVGIEIPNRKAKIVYIKEIIGSEAYTDTRLHLPLALGKTISGKPFVTDLAKMPHLLIAGATGSGKSVCINSLITSMIYRLHPRDLKFIFIDPKMLELSVYAGIPHLGRPVVTDPKRAEKVLSDAVGDMENRYRKLAGEAVRNIEDYNAKKTDPEERIPYIVIIVDELADMMMAASSSRIEMLVTRLAQMARAVGIHLILATQRPSVDVITGLIKANFSARIAFQVATKVDSRTILDGNGAEKLLGNGDMLFLQTGQPEPVRLHGAFISGDETANIVKFITDQFPRQTRAEGAIAESDEEAGEVDFGDPLFLEAAQTVVRHKQGSVSLLQRKLGIGYQRAARLIDRLEAAGIVSAYDGSKAREVLVDETQLEKLMISNTLTDLNS